MELIQIYKRGKNITEFSLFFIHFLQSLTYYTTNYEHSENKLIQYHLRIDAFELWCWRRLFRVPWTARRSNQSIQKEINPEYFGIRKDTDVGKDWRQEEKGATEDEMVGWHHWLNGYEFAQAQKMVKNKETWQWCSAWGGRVGHDCVTEQYLIYQDWFNCPVLSLWASSGSWWWAGKPRMLQSMGSQRIWQDWVTKLNWTEFPFSASISASESNQAFSYCVFLREFHCNPLSFLCFSSPYIFWRVLVRYFAKCFLMFMLCIFNKNITEDRSNGVSFFHKPYQQRDNANMSHY